MLLSWTNWRSRTTRCLTGVISGSSRGATTMCCACALRLICQHGYHEYENERVGTQTKTFATSWSRDDADYRAFRALYGDHDFMDPTFFNLIIENSSDVSLKSLVARVLTSAGTGR